MLPGYPERPRPPRIEQSDDRGAEQDQHHTRPPPPPPGALAACALPYVAITAKRASGGDSHQGVILLFRNTGQIACALTGYPGAALVNAKGQQVKQAARTPSGYLGGLRKGKPTTIALYSGATASALLEGEVVDINGKTCATTPSISGHATELDHLGQARGIHHDVRRNPDPSRRPRDLRQQPVSLGASV